jgi:hypothetical protein
MCLQLTVVESCVHQQLGDLANLGISKQLRDLLMEDRWAAQHSI